jgi:hypothetical protein
VTRLAEEQLGFKMKIATTAISATGHRFRTVQGKWRGLSPMLQAVETTAHQFTSSLVFAVYLLLPSLSLAR